MRFRGLLRAAILCLRTGMASISVPLSIVYDTKGATPLADVIAALQAADIAINDAVSLLPSFVNGLHIENSRVNVRVLSQESPLREIFLVALIVAFQDDLNSEIPPMLEDLLKVNIPDSYDSIVTVVTMIVLFYGAGFLKDAALKLVEDGSLRRQVKNLIAQLSARTGKSEDEIRKVLEAKYGKPGPVKRLAKAVHGFFLPSQREGGVPIDFDRERVPSEVIREIPYAEEFDEKEDFERYESHSGVTLEIHAQDRDKINTGWAAVPKGLADSRLRMKLIEPVTAHDLWTKDTVVGDITLIFKITADGYVPHEIHLTHVY